VLPVLTNLGTSAVVVNAGGVVRFPGLTTYDMGPPCTVTAWEVSGAGSVLDLSSLTNLAGGTCGTLSISAKAGGLLNLSNLTTITGGAVAFVADGTNSIVRLDALRESLVVDETVSLTARNAGEIFAPDFPGGSTVTVSLETGGVIPVVQLSSLAEIRVNGMTATFPGLTNLDRGSIEAVNGAMVTLPALTGYARGDCTLAAWLVSGPSVVDLPALARIDTGVCAAFDITALNGGMLLMGSVTNIAGGNVDILADGAGSLIDLHSLSGFVNTVDQSRLIATNGGTILLPQPVVFSGVTVDVAPGTPGLPAQRIGTNTILYGAP